MKIAMNNLKPCPFCGGEVHIKEGDVHHNIGTHDIKIYIECDACGLEMSDTIDLSSLYKGNDELVKRWNSRK